MTNQPEYDRSPDYNVIDPLTTAEIDLLPVGEALGEAMGLSPIKALERDVFSGVERVHVLEHTEGIGDAVVALRQARVNATRYPDKQFNVYVPNAVLDLPFALPANVALRSADVRPEDMRIDDDFFMCASPILNASQLMFRDNAGLANIRIDLLRIKKAEEQGHFLTALVSRGEDFSAGQALMQAMGELDARFGTSLVDSNLSYADASKALPARVLGVSASVDELSPSLFTPLPEMQLPPTYDFLLVPDAKEGTFPDDADVKRSMKSLTVAQWDAIASQLPEGLRCAVVRGTSHPDYCDEVVRRLQSHNVQVTPLTTDTLGGFASAVAASRKVIVMDSGTAHVAGEVVKAAQPFRPIELRELYDRNTPYVLNEYCLRDLPSGQGRVFVSNISLQDIEATALAQFMVSD